MANPVRTKRPRSPLNRLVRAVSYQKKTPLSMPLRERLTALRHGFRSSAYTLYDLSINDPKDYLPDTAFREATAINGPFCRSVLHDKLLFAELMRGALKSEGFRVPEVFALLEHGQLHPLHARGTLSDLLAAHGGVVLKPTAGWQGAGILNVSEQSGTVVVNGKPSSLAALEEQMSRLSGYLVTERIVQDGYAHDVFPSSVNSVRAITMQDPDDDHRPFIAVAIQRFGSRTTGPTDNISRGGLMAQIDHETGVMGPAIKFPHETGGKLSWCSRHPDTGVTIEGARVSGWNALQADLLKLVEATPLFRYVGWDIVPTRQACWLVEGNHNPSPAIQVFHPYLRDPKIRRFFEFYGVV